jgi:hypothetical protein
MDNRPLRYMTFHRVRFSSAVSGHTTSFSSPQLALHWLFGPQSELGPSGLPTMVSNVWGGVAFYGDLSEAQAAFANAPGEQHFDRNLVEAWHGLLCPIGRKGENNWFGAVDGAPRLAPAETDPDPRGLLAVVTTAGYKAMTREELKADLQRRADFAANVHRVRDWYATLPGTLALGLFNFMPMGTDGMTFSLWRNDAAMIAAAFRPGMHREQLDRYRTAHTADRTSFMRTRVLNCAGTWEGVSVSVV